MTNEELQKIYVKADMKLDALKDNIHHLAEENKQLKENWSTRTKSYNKVVLKNADLEQENKQLKDKINKLEILIETLYYGITRNDEQQQLLNSILEEIPQFKGTLQELDNLSILGDKENE